MEECMFCNKILKNKISRAQHEKFCKKNPNKKECNLNWKLRKTNSNKFLKAESMGLEKPKVSLETKEKLKEKAIEGNKKRWLDPENRRKYSEIMIQTAKNHPDSYSISNRSRAKHYEYKGERFQGTWELEFFKYCERNKIECKRNRECFPYFWKEKIHYYYPDFYLEKFNLFIEIKGYETDRDVAKQRDFPSNRKLLILRKKEYDLFIKDQFILDL